MSSPDASEADREDSPEDDESEPFADYSPEDYAEGNREAEEL